MLADMKVRNIFNKIIFILNQMNKNMPFLTMSLLRKATVQAIDLYSLVHHNSLLYYYWLNSDKRIINGQLRLPHATQFYIHHADILSRSLGKYTTYHPCIIVIKYNSKKGLLKVQKMNKEWKYLTNACQKKLVLSHYVLSLFNGGVIYISPMY